MGSQHYGGLSQRQCRKVSSAGQSGDLNDRLQQFAEVEGKGLGDAPAQGNGEVGIQQWGKVEMVVRGVVDDKLGHGLGCEGNTGARGEEASITSIQLVMAGDVVQLFSS